LSFFVFLFYFSLFFFLRFKENLKNNDDMHEAMLLALREICVPIFYSAATVLGAMLILSFAQFGDYKNFSLIFVTAVFVVLISSATIIPALFTIFGRVAFSPKIPRVGDAP